jgi:hypothetical protein
MDKESVVPSLEGHMGDDTARPEENTRETRVTDIRIIAWSLVVTAFGTLWIAFQLTLIAADL